MRISTGSGLGEPFRAWGPLALDGLRRDGVDAVLERGGAGISLPAGAFEPPSSLDSLAPVLARIEALDVPLFIHPGPGLGSRPGECGIADPLWWPALTHYVAQMQAAWLAFNALARRAHPRLRVVFAMLAGGAPQGVPTLTASADALAHPRRHVLFVRTRPSVGSPTKSFCSRAARTPHLPQRSRQVPSRPHHQRPARQRHQPWQSA